MATCLWHVYGYMLPRGYHFNTSFVLGPSKPKRVGSVDVAINNALIGSQIFCQKMRAVILQ